MSALYEKNEYTDIRISDFETGNKLLLVFMHSVTEMIEILKNDLIEARVSFDIWAALTNIDNRNVYEPAMLEYQTYFQSTIGAQFQNIIIILYRVFESRKDTVNFKNLIDLVCKGGELDDPVKDKIISFRSQTDITWKKVADLRSQYFAHRTNKHKAEYIYSRSGVSRNSLRSLMKDFEQIYNEISLATLGTQFVFESLDWVETDNLIKDLATKKP